MTLDADGRTLYIGNLHKSVSQDILYELFLQAGPVERVCVVPKKNNSAGYGFVTYKHELSIDYALELFKGIELFKRKLIIKKRVPKQSNDVKGSEFQDQLHQLQLLAQNLKQNPHIVDFSVNPNPSWGNRSNRNQPYNIVQRNNHLSRPRERNEGKNRNHGNKQYHGRKGRRRD